MLIKHYDLFAGIGGFSLALDTVFHEETIEHIFCEWESFPTAVLKKHWPDATYYGDIADLVTDTERARLEGSQQDNTQGYARQRGGERSNQDESISNATNTTNTRTEGVRGREKPTSITIVTGGFPCQPFSVAGRRQGTADNRYKWPEMFAVIRNVKPDWVIAENVRGLVTWNDGMVLETVCADLESEGYEVQPLIIPACAIGAPHRRDRVWIVANLKHNGVLRAEATRNHNQTEQVGKTRSFKTINEFEGKNLLRRQGFQRQRDWSTDWHEVALATCHDRVDDGLPRWMDGVTISASKHRRERLKACGNAIVPQVAMEIFETIKLSNPKK